MPDIALIKKVDALDDDCATVETPESEVALLLGETATREACLALSALLDGVSPYKPEKQDAIGYLHEEIMDAFAFGRGSYLTLTSRNAYLLNKAFEQYSPDDESVFENVVTTVDAYIEEIQSETD